MQGGGRGGACLPHGPRPGECIGLVGHNGAGKSTIISVINGGITPERGHVAGDGRRNDGYGVAAARALGVRSVFQELALCPNLSIAENTNVAHRELGWRNRRKVARRIIETSLGGIFPGHGIDCGGQEGELSIAQRQMVEIAMAFSSPGAAPRLVILDEPTSSLDAGLAAQLLAHVRRFTAAGGAVILISHILDEILATASRSVVMKDGRSVAERPARGFTQAILASVLIAVLAQLIVMRSTLGVRIRAVGGNARTVERAGTSVLRTRAAAYGLAAGFAVLSGMTLVGTVALKAMATDDGMVLPGLLIALAVSALAWVALNRTVHSRQVPAIGQSQPAAQMSGIPVDGVRLATHVLCALLAALNGFLLSCFSGGAAHNIGSEYLLMSIAPEGRPPLREVPEMPATSPATPYLVEDARFLHLTVASARPECLATGCRWAEGPVWFADLGCLLFSDIPNQRILRWSADAAGGGGGVTVFRQPSNFANGQTRDREGRLVTCEHGGRRVTRTETDGTLTVLAERFDGRRLNSPNDVVVASDGAVWFTDPTYGILSDYEGFRAEPEQPVRGVYRLDPSGRLDRVADDFLQPNGLAFSPDEAVLYVADSGASHLPEAPRHILAFDVRDGRLRRPRVFATIDAGIPDGIRVDDEGNLWSSAGDGVHCFAPDGTRLGRILLPETVANLAFGGPRRNRLFLTATSSLYAVYLAVAGASRP